MPYDETTFRRQGSDSGVAPGPGARSGASAPGPSRRTVAEDDAETRPDRLGVHLGWELVLLLAVVAGAFLLHQLEPNAVRGSALDTLLVSATAIGLLILGASVTLRAGVPNLAVGPIAVAAALQFAENGDQGVMLAAAPALAIAAAGGLVVALFVIGFHVPGWMATTAGAFGVIVFIQLRPAPVIVQGAYEPGGQAWFLFTGFAVLALLGGLLGSVAPIRSALGRPRPVADPARRRGAGVALPVISSLVLSCALAVVAGVLMAAQSTTPVVPTTGLEWTGIALGAALVAGTSAFGRRGGVFGTLLAACGVALFLGYQQHRAPHVTLFAMAAVMITAGLIVTRLVETYGRPRSVEDDWETLGGSWAPDLPGSWSPAGSPASSANWDDVRWGSTRG